MKLEYIVAVWILVLIPSTTGETEIGESSEKCICIPYYMCVNGTISRNGEPVIDRRGSITTTTVAKESSIRKRDVDKTCDSFVDHCCNIGETPDSKEEMTPKPTSNPFPLSNACGKRSSNLSFVHAEESKADFGELPWTVAIAHPVIHSNLIMFLYECSGSLIHPQVVVTAAQCVKGKANLTARMGEWNANDKSEPFPTQSKTVKKVMIHEKYSDAGLHNDIALLLLESPVELAPSVATICLPAQDESMDNRTCLGSGWGKNGIKGKYQSVMKKIELPVVSRAPCLDALRESRLGSYFELHRSFLCAGGVEGKDTCKGDGGGPLACPSTDNPSKYVLGGITSWGIDCGNEVPGVYVNVAHFRNWIDNQLHALATELKN